MTRTERSRRFSINYRSWDPREPHWLVRVLRFPGSGTVYCALPPLGERWRARTFPTIADACDYARSQQPAPTEVPC